MAQGQERRAQPTDNLRGQDAINPVSRTVPQLGNVRAPSAQAATPTFGARIAEQVGGYIGGQLANIQQQRQEKSALDGTIAGLQGQSFESVEMDGDKWAMEGHRMVTAQTISATLMRAQEQEIASGAYEADPDTYRATLVDRITNMTSEIEDPRTRRLAQEQLMSQMPALVDGHMTRNLAFKEQQNFEALANSVDVLSRDASSTGAMIAFATGQSEATAGLSIERRRAAVTEGVVNSFNNNNPAAYAHLEQAGLLTTEHLTAGQLNQLRSAQNQYEARIRAQWNGELKAEMTALEDKVAVGDLNPIQAAEQQAAIMARHGLRQSAQEGSGIYDRARAGVEFDEGTRGLNIQSAGLAGDYQLQARLMTDAVIKQESNGNPNAVSPVGATGIMQIMPATAADPGYGVRNIFQVATDMGVPFDRNASNATAEADRLMRNPAVNEAMGTEYLETMLERYNGDVNRALAAYNWGPGKADDWDGDLASLPEETRGYIRNITANFSDNRPDPQAHRVAAETRYNNIREQAQLQVLEQMGPAMAENDEMFTSGNRTLADWRTGRESIYSEWGQAIDSQRINQEQQMMRRVFSDRINEVRAEQDNVESVQTAVALETGLAAAEVQLQERRDAFEAGDRTISLQEINEEYMGSMLEAYTASGAELDASRISKDAGDIVHQSADLVSRALVAQEEAAIISNAETANTVGSLPKPLMDRAVDKYRNELLPRAVENFRAENPNATSAQIGALQRQEEIQYLADNGIVDEAMKQQINLAASGNWLDASGNARPATVVGLQSFVSLMAANPDLAYQYVPDAASRGRMMAASHQVLSLFPDRQVFTDVDLQDRNDPTANAFYEAVQQIGLADKANVTPEETSRRINTAITALDKGNLDNSWFGGITATSAAGALTASTWLGAGMSGRFEIADVRAQRSTDFESVNAQYKGHVQQFLEETMPHMPATAQEGAVKMALEFVRDRGALMGSSYVMPADNEASINAQMFPGQQNSNPSAVNTAITQWLLSDEVAASNPLMGDWRQSQNRVHEAFRAISPFHERNEGSMHSPEYTVTRVNGQYRAHIAGVGSIMLPLREIGDLYTSNR